MERSPIWLNYIGVYSEIVKSQFKFLRAASGWTLPMPVDYLESRFSSKMAGIFRRRSTTRSWPMAGQAEDLRPKTEAKNYVRYLQAVAEIHCKQ
jgi:hypothetical protein